MPRRITCPVCGAQYSRASYIKHLEEQHLHFYLDLEDKLQQDIKTGKSIKLLASEYHVTQRFITSLVKKTYVINENSKPYYKVGKIDNSKWGPENFRLEETSVWSFPDRGSWATHSGKYRGNWTPYIPRNVIERYSKENDVVLDQFVGSGTTLIEAKILGRNGIGVDINPEAISLTRLNINFPVNNHSRIELHIGDARNLHYLKDNSIDLICTHPPYSNIIRYSDSIKGDLSHLDIKDFLLEIRSVALECFRILKKGKICAILIGDTRKQGHIIPLGFNLMNIFIDIGFKLKEIVIKQQHNCKTTYYWREKSQRLNFLLLAHEYLFIFQKP